MNDGRKGASLLTSQLTRELVTLQDEVGGWQSPTLKAFTVFNCPHLILEGSHAGSPVGQVSQLHSPFAGDHEDRVGRHADCQGKQRE